MRLLYLIGFLIFLTGCATTMSETHYFKDKAGTPPNYYRLKIKGNTFLTSSRYVTGYYDEEAVALYFNEIAQPKKGTLVEIKTKENQSGVESLKNSLQGKNLVIILSTNSDAIAQAIGSFAGSQQILTALAGLLNRDRIVESKKTSTEIKVQGIKSNSLADLGTSLIGGLPDNASEPQARAALLQYANALATELGNTTPFTSLDGAAIWLKDNRTKITR